MHLDVWNGCKDNTKGSYFFLTCFLGKYSFTLPDHNAPTQRNQ